MSVLRSLGVVLLVSIFALSSFNHVVNHEALVPGAISTLARYGVSEDLARACYWANTAFLVVGSVFLLVGAFHATLRRLGAACLLVFLLPVTFTMHAFWESPDGSVDQKNHMAHFLKNLSIVGGLLYLLATPAPPRAVVRSVKVTTQETRKRGAKKAD